MAAASEDTEGTSWDFALEARLYFKLGLISRVEYEQWAETFTGIPLAEFTQAPEQELLETLLATQGPRSKTSAMMTTTESSKVRNVLGGMPMERRTSLEARQ